MKYLTLIKKIKSLAGARDDESQDALEVVVENVAVCLNDYNRRSFAARLPEELQNAAMMVPTATQDEDTIIEQYMELEGIDEHRARNHLQAAWQALTEVFDHEYTEDITSSLPRDMRAILE